MFLRHHSQGHSCTVAHFHTTVSCLPPHTSLLAAHAWLTQQFRSCPCSARNDNAPAAAPNKASCAARIDPFENGTVIFATERCTAHPFIIPTSHFPLPAEVGRQRGVRIWRTMDAFCVHKAANEKVPITWRAAYLSRLLFQSRACAWELVSRS